MLPIGQSRAGNGRAGLTAAPVACPCRTSGPTDRTTPARAQRNIIARGWRAGSSFVPPGSTIGLVGTEDDDLDRQYVGDT